jgi:hypothetical protein
MVDREWASPRCAEAAVPVRKGERAAVVPARMMLLPLYCPWQLIDLVSCHVDLDAIADAVELVIGDCNHVTAEAEKSTDFDSDGDFAPRSGHHTMDGAKIGPV